MYKLLSLTATNFIGFRSGLSKKTVKIDLRNVIDNNMIVILGDNGVGKSTFTSLIPPLHEPYGVNKSFIIEGKEGLLIREYINDEGKIIVTKCVYLPKKDKGHTTKAYIGYTSENDGFIPLNPEGTVSSYLDIVEKEFNVSRASLQLTYYDDNVKDIVRMTRSERVNNINKFVTVNKRYNAAFNIINDKYRAAKNIMKNTIQKLSNLREESKLDNLLINIEDEITVKSKYYEDIIEAISKKNTLIEHKLNGKSLFDFSSEYEELSSKIKNIRSTMKSLDCEDLKLSEIEGLLSKIEKDCIKYEESLKNSKLEFLQNNLYELENELLKYDEEDYSDADNIETLKESLTEIENILDNMEYSKNPKLYNEVSDFEVELLIKLINEISYVFDNGISLYGSKFYKDIELSFNNKNDVEIELNRIKSNIDKEEKELRDKQEELNSLKIYKGLSDTLEKRPEDCTIDTCPFIAQAIEAKQYIERISILEDIVSKYDTLLKRFNDEYSGLYEDLELYSLQIKICGIVIDHDDLFYKYFNIDAEKVFKSLKKGLIPEEFNQEYLANLRNILSERENYNELTNVTKPLLMNKIVQIENNSKYIKIVTERVDELKKKIKSTRSEMLVEQDKYNKNKESLEECEKEKEIIQKMIEDRIKYDSLDSELLNLLGKVSEFEKLEVEVSSMKKEIKELMEEKTYYDKELASLYKDRDIIKFENIQVKSLKMELAENELDFKMLEILKIICQPGSGIIKDTIDIFMKDIQETANVLISKAFNGKLFLRNFIITDDAFDIPFVFNGMPGSDISNASSSQRWIVSSCISLAILSKILNGYGIVIYDEPDKTLSPQNREEFIRIISEYSRYIGLNQSYIITHSPEFYEGYDAGFILFPGFRLSDYKSTNYVKIQ